MKIELPNRNNLIELSTHYKDWEEDALWAYCHKNPLIRSVYTKRLQTIIDIVPPKKFKHILDLGTGSGILIPTLFKMGKSISGIDINENLMHVREMLLKLNIHPHFTVGDVRDLPYRDNQFDLIICSSVLEHLNKNDLIKSIKTIRKIMKNDGYLIIGYPKENWIVKIFFRLIKFNSKDHHLSSYNEIRNVIKSRLRIIKRKRMPVSFLPDLLSFYEVLLCKKFQKSL